PFRSITEDLEPEYITVTPDGNTAFVALQENNTLAKINLTTLAVELLPLGTKDHSQPGNEIDASDDDGDTFNLQNYPVMGLFMPDAIASFSSGGTDYVITANEGDARDEDEDIRNVTLDPTAFPDAATLQLTPNAGNLEISTIEGDTDGDTDFDELFTYGARSFSIFDSDGNLVFDSGSALAQIANGAGIYPDDRSDNKGTEPEGVTTGVVGTRNFAFVGLERASAILAYDITTPASPAFQQIVFDQPNDISPEGLTFVSAAESPSGVPLLIVTNEVSNTLAVYSVAIPNQPDITFNQKGRGGPIVGEDLYTASGAGQSLRLRAKKRSVFKFNVGNDGSATATYAVRGFKLPRKRFKLRFLQTSPARSNVTASVRTGREAETIGAGATASYQAIISKTTSRPARISEKVSATGGALTDLMTYRASFR
ncbi:MAG: choice-of-anchor I family protein, partial [Verrucomicrobiota bacterium]